MVEGGKGRETAINLFPNFEIRSKEEMSVIGELMGDTENVEISMGCGCRKYGQARSPSRRDGWQLQEQDRGHRGLSDSLRAAITRYLSAMQAPQSRPVTAPLTLYPATPAVVSIKILFSAWQDGRWWSQSVLTLTHHDHHPTLVHVCW